MKVVVPIASLDDDIIQPYYYSNKSARHNTRTTCSYSARVDKYPENCVDLCSSTKKDPVREMSSSVDNLLDDLNVEFSENDSFTSMSKQCRPYSDAVADSLENFVTDFDEKLQRSFSNFNDIPLERKRTNMDTSKNRASSVAGDTVDLNIGSTSRNLPPLYLENIEASEGTMVNSCIVADFRDNNYSNGISQRSDTLGSVSVTQQNFDSFCDSGRGYSIPSSNSPTAQFADQVIEEIDFIMQHSFHSSRTANSEAAGSLGSPCAASLFQDELTASCRTKNSLIGGPEELQSLPTRKLKIYHNELQSLIQVYNEALVRELAIRDELEYEKELKNTLISLMSAIQTKKRKFHMQSKRKLNTGHNAGLLFLNGFKEQPQSFSAPQYLTTVIPFDFGSQLTNRSLEALIKLLRAIIDDSPNVPTMLTDYILNVLCPSVKC